MARCLWFIALYKHRVLCSGWSYIHPLPSSFRKFLCFNFQRLAFSFGGRSFSKLYWLVDHVFTLFIELLFGVTGCTFNQISRKEYLFCLQGKGLLINGWMCHEKQGIMYWVRICTRKMRRMSLFAAELVLVTLFSSFLCRWFIFWFQDRLWW